MRRRFPDGVLWATLGQEPDVLSVLSVWVRALGDYEFTRYGTDAAANYLRTLLEPKAALVVIDDAWNQADVASLLVGGPQCRVLITTRERAIAKALRVEPYGLGALTPGQALQLFEELLRRELKKPERASAEALAAEVGYLPLGVELAAVQVGDGRPWDELLRALREEVARLEVLEDPDEGSTLTDAERKALSLRASFHLSLRRLTPRRYREFAWLGVLPDDVALGPAMAATLWDTDEQSASDGLRALRDHAALAARC